MMNTSKKEKTSLGSCYLPKLDQTILRKA